MANKTIKKVKIFLTSEAIMTPSQLYQIHMVLDMLKPHERNYIIARFFWGLSLRQLGDIMGCSHEAVRICHERPILRKLAQLMKKRA